MDLTPPKFSGDFDSTDFFSFKNSFDEYSSIKIGAETDAVIILKNKCLKGAALKACKNLSTLPEIWARLKKLYGDPKKLISAKMNSLLSLGKCSLAISKGKEWGINMKAELVHIQDLARKHNILDMVYYSSIIDQVQSMLPDQFYDKFQDKLLERHPDPSRREILNNCSNFLII